MKLYKLHNITKKPLSKEGNIKKKKFIFIVFSFILTIFLAIAGLFIKQFLEVKKSFQSSPSASVIAKVSIYGFLGISLILLLISIGVIYYVFNKLKKG